MSKRPIDPAVGGFGPDSGVFVLMIFRCTQECRARKTGRVFSVSRFRTEVFSKKTIRVEPAAEFPVPDNRWRTAGNVSSTGDGVAVAASEERAKQSQHTLYAPDGPGGKLARK